MSKGGGGMRREIRRVEEGKAGQRVGEGGCNMRWTSLVVLLR